VILETVSRDTLAPYTSAKCAEIGLGRGAGVTAGPFPQAAPPEPDVRLSPHPALHEFRPSGMVLAVTK
jgi:hypothetical protein